MATGKDLSGLEKAIGYSFHDRDLLQCAVTHSSYANEMKTRIPGIKSNERLEFLGDAVLEESVSRYLFFRFKDKPEGELTKLRQALVCRECLAEIASGLSLGDYLSLGNGDEAHGNKRESPFLLANALEAVIAAVSIDGGHQATEDLIGRIILSHEAKIVDYKSRLQTLVQQDGIEELSYRVIREEGPEHDKVFEVEALINSNPVGHGFGKTKRDAEQNAAKEALDLFGIKE